MNKLTITGLTKSQFRREAITDDHRRKNGSDLGERHGGRDGEVEKLEYVFPWTDENYPSAGEIFFKYWNGLALDLRRHARKFLPGASTYVPIILPKHKKK